MDQSYKEFKDEEIVLRVQKGEKQIFGILVDRYQEKLLRYGKKFISTREDIVDMVQEIFLNTYKNIQSFDVKQRFSPWIYRIAHNVFVNGLAKKERTPIINIDFDTLISHPIYEDPSEREREGAEIKKILDQKLTELSAKYREILVLYYYEEMNYKDIADILRIPTSTVGVRLKRAREEIKKQWSTI